MRLSVCFVSVEFIGRSAKAAIMTFAAVLSFSSFCLLPCFPPHRPYDGSLFLFLVLFCPCNRCLFLFSTYICCSCSLSFPIALHHILHNTCRLFPFVFSFFFSSFFLLSCFVPLLFVWLVLLCYRTRLLCDRTRYASILLAVP